jgi:sulfite reductase alpha subunit-like flavoprotein
MIDLKGILPSLFLSIEFILQKLPTIMPRYYTIASSSLANPKDLAIAISLTQMPLADGATKLGLASKYF